MRTRFALLSTVAATLLLAGPAFAQNQNMPKSNQPLSKHDMSFVKQAAAGGMAEVELGKLAQQNGQSDQVKQFGARMVQDHSAANKDLMSIAQSKGMNLPQQLDKKDQETLDKLSQLHGAAFDRAYMRDMVKDHDKDVKEFRREAQSANDPDLKQFAAKTASVIEEHDKLARDVDHSLTAAGSSQRRR